MAAASAPTMFKSPIRFLLRRGFSDSPAASLTMETALPFSAHKCDPPPRSVTTSPSELLSFFRTMTIMRRMELAADSLYKAKLVRGFCHLYDGQEAVAVGMEAAITRRDAIITAYRDHCIYVARGGSPFEVFSELMGRRAGCSKGKGGSMHLYKKDASFYGGHGIVGAHVPLGCGIALGQKYSKEGTVTFVVYGDGAANQGQLYESLNMAALWDLPVVLVCENNHYGMGTAEWRASKNPAYYKRADYVPGVKVFKRRDISAKLVQRAESCGFKAIVVTVDGMDVLAVKQACKFAKEYVLQNGPIVLEMDTYRYHGHSMSDPGSTYRTRDEITGVRQERDPIERVRKLILSLELASASELKDIEKEVRKETDEAIAKAKESPMPDPTELFKNIFVESHGAEAFGPDRKEVKIVLP